MTISSPSSPSLVSSSALEWLRTPEAILDIERELCRRSLIEFVRRAWHIVEPKEPFVHGWHLDAIAVHLEAVTRGEITRLLINVPPGTMKSLLTSVFWPAWEWGPAGLAPNRYMAASYEIGIATRDTRKMRQLIESEWFQTRWPLPLAGDQNEKTKFENAHRGFRLARSIDSLTGERADRLMLDDPHSVKIAESDLRRATSVTNFREAANNRLNSAERSAIIVIMQRIHQGDISGEILDKIGGYVSLVLPMEYEPDRHCETPWFSDPRTEPGELLFPGRFPAWTIERDKPIFGEYAWAGQYQQRPAPRETGMFRADRIQIVERAPPCTEWVRGWDFAGTADKRADWTVGVLIGKCEAGYVIADVVRKQLTPNDVRRLIRATAELDGREVQIRGPQDPGQAGKAQALDFATLLDGFRVRFAPVTGSKEVRAEPFAAQVEAGRVMMVKAPWNDAFTAELAMFPAGRHDDQVDAATEAYNALIGKRGLPTGSASWS
jgi:predicted phage terminase large subunit-like protein